MNVRTLERCFTDRIDRELVKILDSIEDRIQNAIWTVIDIIITPRMELATKSINESSGRDAVSVTANSERR